MLDEACRTGDYSAISSFHFGADDFLQFEPFLMEWEGRIGMVGLQDAHGGEGWWWANELAGFRTLYLAEDPSWNSFLKAMDQNFILSVRRDASTNYEIEWSGASPAVRQFVAAREHEWAWWREDSSVLPLASVALLRPDMPFEVDAPNEGLRIRVRLRYDLGKNPNRALLQKPLSELVHMKIDGQAVYPKEIVLEHDRYLIHQVQQMQPKKLEILVRDISSGRTEFIQETLISTTLDGVLSGKH